MDRQTDILVVELLSLCENLALVRGHAVTTLSTVYQWNTSNISYFKSDNCISGSTKKLKYHKIKQNYRWSHKTIYCDTINYEQ